MGHKVYHCRSRDAVRNYSGGKLLGYQGTAVSLAWFTRERSLVYYFRLLSFTIPQRC